MKPRPYSRLSHFALRLSVAIVLALASPVLIAPSLLHAQNLPNLGGTGGEELSPLMERRLGEQVMNNIQRDPDYLEDAPTLDYLNQLGGQLLGTSQIGRAHV